MGIYIKFDRRKGFIYYNENTDSEKYNSFRWGVKRAWNQATVYAYLKPVANELILEYALDLFNTRIFKIKY